MKEDHNSVREKPFMEDSGPAIVKTPLARVCQHVCLSACVHPSQAAVTGYKMQ